MAIHGFKFFEPSDLVLPLLDTVTNLRLATCGLMTPLPVAGPPT
jgi:hypothetical protein